MFPRRSTVGLHGQVRPTVGGLVLLLTFLGTESAFSQVIPEIPRFSTSTAAIVVDVVVRDQRHRPVSGLKAADFEILEDGVEQSITSFEAIGISATGRSSTTSTQGAASEASTDQGTPVVVALVFEQLSAWGRQLAYKAARAFVTDTLTRADFAGVFAADRALHVIVPYTNDLGELQSGLRDASMRAGYALERAGQVPGAEYSSSEGGQSAQASIDDSPYMRGHGTFEALERLIDSMQVLPGRKAVVLFSEGLALMAAKDISMLPEGSWHDTDSWLTDNRREHFTRVFERANRAHVAFYTFDAAGLRIESPLIQKCFGCAPYVGLQMLAAETGGAFVENTNDLAGPVRRVGEDLRHYYLLGYTSTNPTLDDKYRSIEVKVSRPDVTVLARRGYRASPQPESVQVRPYEIGPLLVLDNPRVPNAFPIRIGTFAFPERSRPGRTAIVARVPASAIDWSEGVGDGQQSARVTVMARVKDAAGRSIAYASDRYDLTRAARGAPGDILFYKETDLPPGVHTLELVAYRENTHTASVRIATVETGKPVAGIPQVSSLITLRSAERAGTRPEGRAAVHFGDWLLVPNLGEAVDADTELAFAFAIEGSAANSHLKAAARILRGGRSIAGAPLALPPPGADGRIPYVGRIPLPTLEAGTYQLAVTISDAETTIQRLAAFHIADR